MIDFCAQHDITAKVEVMPAPQVNEVLARLRRNDVRYRFVSTFTRAEHDAEAARERVAGNVVAGRERPAGHHTGHEVILARMVRVCSSSDGRLFRPAWSDLSAGTSGIGLPSH